MKNLLKKTVFILIALTVLLCVMSTFAEEATETGEVNIPTFEVGSGTSGTLQPDAAKEFQVHAGKRGRVQFTLSLAEDCGVSVTVNGGVVALARPDDDLPIYTFISRFKWDESKILSMTAEKKVGYSIMSELLPEEPTPEAEQEETAVEEPATELSEKSAEESAAESDGESVEEPEAKSDGESVEKPETEPTAEPAEESVKEPFGDSVEKPAADPGEGSVDESATEPAQEPAEEPAAEGSAETVSSEQDTKSEAAPVQQENESAETEAPEQQEPAEEGNATEPEKNPTEGSEAESAEEPGEASDTPYNDAEPEAESGETEQPAQPEEFPEGTEAADQPEGQSEDHEAEQPDQHEEQHEEPEAEQSADEQQAQQGEQTEEPETKQSAEEQPNQPAEQHEEPDTEQPGEEHAAQQEEQSEEPETENSEGAANSVEIIIAKSLTPDESWNGTVRKKKPTILKLDVAEAGMIHMFVEGKDVLYSVQKSDRITDDAGYTLTDAETNSSITSFDADPGSYLISIRAGENSMGARVAVSFKNDAEFAAWEAEQAALEEANTSVEEVPEETEGKPEGEVEEETENEPESALSAERHVKLQLTWDTDEPAVGDVAHLRAVMTGYEGVKYSLQWQNSADGEYWRDIAGETKENLDIMITDEMNNLTWRVMVYVETAPEAEQE